MIFASSHGMAKDGIKKRIRKTQDKKNEVFTIFKFYTLNIFTYLVKKHKIGNIFGNPI